MVQVEIISTEELGDRSYLAHDGTDAIVVDPQRDLDRVFQALEDKGLRCAMVVETHIHNDYVSGGHTLASQLGVDHLGSAADHVAFDRRGVTDGDQLAVGTMTLRVLATPGHTDTHLAYVIEDGHGAPAVFTGGSLLYGSVGRTDLVEGERTTELTHAQYHSVHRLAELLPDETRVYPTHGFGSFCSSGAATGGQDSTIGTERRSNDALTEADEDAFVRRLVTGLTAYPRYYTHMDARNRQGPDPIDLSPPRPVDPAELGRKIATGEWVVDLRDRTAYALQHLTGTIGIALGTQFATYLGWLIPWGSPVTLIGDTAEQVADAQRQLARIGIDRPAGAATGQPAELAPARRLGCYPSASFDDLAERTEAGEFADDHKSVLDVRRGDERTDGAVTGSVHIPLQDLLERIDEAPAGQLWVHCASGYRASIAASLLDRAGRDVVLLDDNYDRAVELGLTTS
jgi:glyoxylase-like metal-dependent hydrolase (beta-lactamase superfamily II)/rhodanese-related sulfurtransferase